MTEDEARTKAASHALYIAEEAAKIAQALKGESTEAPSHGLTTHERIRALVVDAKLLRAAASHIPE